MVTAKPRFSQQRFDHMRRLIDKIKQRAHTRNDSEMLAEAELLDALLVNSVEDQIMDGSINVPSLASQSHPS